MQRKYGRPVRRDWAELTTGAGYLLVLVGTAVVGIAELHPHGIGRIVLPILLAVAALNAGAMVAHLAFTWRNVPVLIEDEADTFGGDRSDRR